MPAPPLTPPIRWCSSTSGAAQNPDLVLYGAPALDTAALPNVLLANLPGDHRAEVSGIAREVRDVRSIPSAAVVDDELPRALGWSNGWGYGDPLLLSELSFDELSSLITRSWADVTPLVSEAGLADLTECWPAPAVLETTEPHLVICPESS